MNNIEQTIISGILPKYIDAYLSDIAETVRSDGFYYGLDWQIQVIPDSKSKLSNPYVTQTLVIFKSNEATLKKLVHNFRMNFLSAGG